MKANTILWPTDLSKHSLTAAPVVRDIAEAQEARIVLLYVGVDLEEFFPAYGSPSEEVTKQFHDWELEEAKKRLKQVCSNELQGCPLMETRITTGSAAEEILRVASEEDADLIVMSPRGLGQEQNDRGQLGSVTARVLEQSPVNVLTVRN